MPILQSVSRSLIVVAAGLAFSTPLFAFRAEFIVSKGGERVPGAEVCFFRAGGSANPFERYLFTDEVRCLPADKVIAIPPGYWNYVARHSSRYVSNHPSLIANPELRKSEFGYRQVSVRLKPAAHLDFTELLPSLQAGEHFVAYFPNEGSELGSSAQPLARGESRLLVPAGTTVVPMVVAASRVTRILSPVRTIEGRVHKPAVRRVGNGTVDVIGWVKLDVSMMRDDEVGPHFGAFSVRAVGPTEAGMAPVPTAFGPAAHMSFQVFLELPAKPTTLLLRGRMWESFELPVAPNGESVVNVPEPIIAAPAGVIVVRWLKRNVYSPATWGLTGHTRGNTEREVSLRLSVCAEGKSALDNLQDICRDLRNLIRGESAGEAEFVGVPMGTYQISANIAEHPEIRKRVYVFPGQETIVDVTPASPMQAIKTR